MSEEFILHLNRSECGKKPPKNQKTEPKTKIVRFWPKSNHYNFVTQLNLLSDSPDYLMGSTQV